MNKIRLILLAISIFVFCGCEISDKRVEKPLKIKMVNDKPCFYIDPFEDMDKFNIRNLQLHKTDSHYSPVVWSEGYFEDGGRQNFYRPVGNEFLFAPSSIAGSDKCIEYGPDLDKNGFAGNELKTDVVYGILMVGYNKEQWASDRKNVEEVDFHVRFYLKKNSQTGKIEAVIVDNNTTKINQ